MNTLKLLAVGAVLAVGVAGVAKADTLGDVQKRGALNCGVNGPTGLTGFGIPRRPGALARPGRRRLPRGRLGDLRRRYQGQICPPRLEGALYRASIGRDRLLVRNSTWTFSRNNDLGLEFVAVNYYDGQGFMVRKELGIDSALKLSGATVCVQTGTTTEKNLADYFQANKMELKSVVFENADQARGAYDEGRCDAYTTDASGLASERTQLKNPSDNIILPEIISKEPLGPVVRFGDDKWGSLVRWSYFAMLIAEEKGITQANVDQIKGSSQDPEVQRLLGTGDDMGKMMGVPKDWAYHVIKNVGNYGESFERNVGLKTPLGLARGLNELWNKGGLQYAPPLR
jgi:ABC-type amino acid transport/signal transduction systems, periplasmic component/domain